MLTSTKLTPYNSGTIGEVFRSNTETIETMVLIMREGGRTPAEIRTMHSPQNRDPGVIDLVQKEAASKTL